MRALIVETGRTRGALAAARALHQAGWLVGVGTPTGRGMASASRATTYRHPIPSPHGDPDAFVEAVNLAVQHCGYEVVFGAGDADMLVLSSRRDEIHALVPYAPHDRVLRAVDKLALAKSAIASGLAVPATVEATDGELAMWSPPYVVKAALHAPGLGGEHRVPFAATIVRDREAARRRAAEIRAAGGLPLLQELVHGRLMAFSAVVDRAGRLVATVVQLAERTWPPAAGVSARAKTMEPDPRLAEGVSRLLDDLGWFGLAQLQFVLPNRSSPSLIDLNGRFYGSLALAVAAGPNLPGIWAALATRRPPPPIARPSIGIRYQWLEGDLRCAAVERRGGLIRDLISCLAYSRGAVQAIWDPRDPRPALRQLALVPRRLITRNRT